jgi:hypothetical protein
MPLCRSWIHCFPRAIARDLVFGPDRRDNEKALRIGFADAYLCELKGFIGIEAYLAFLRHNLRESTLFDWLLEPSFKHALDDTVRSGGVRSETFDKLSCEQLEYLRLVALEAARTSELWTAIQTDMAERGEGMVQRSVGRLVDAWIAGRSLRPRWKARPRLR